MDALSLEYPVRVTASVDSVCATDLLLLYRLSYSAEKINGFHDLTDPFFKYTGTALLNSCPDKKTISSVKNYYKNYPELNGKEKELLGNYLAITKKIVEPALVEMTRLLPVHNSKTAAQSGSVDIRDRFVADKGNAPIAELLTHLTGNMLATAQQTYDFAYYPNYHRPGSVSGKINLSGEIKPENGFYVVKITFRENGNGKVTSQQEFRLNKRRIDNREFTGGLIEMNKYILRFIEANFEKI